jgi:uncharacterized protein YcbK (DUF882 family)
MPTTKHRTPMGAVTKINGYYYWIKGAIAPLSAHFSTTEFQCPCKCQEQKIAVDLVDKLERVRVLLGKAIKVTSGYRCRDYQLDLARRGYETAKGISQHELGRAADIICPGATLYQFAAMLTYCEQEFKAIGEGLTFLHVDLRDDKPARRWYYGVRK